MYFVVCGTESVVGTMLIGWLVVVVSGGCRINVHVLCYRTMVLRSTAGPRPVKQFFFAHKQMQNPKNYYRRVVFFFAEVCADLQIAVVDF